jgi:hypothetical protein
MDSIYKDSDKEPNKVVKELEGDKKFNNLINTLQAGRDTIKYRVSSKKNTK